MIVILAALAAELDGDEDASAPSLYLPFQRKLALIWRLQRGKQGAALADELVQLEGEGASAIVAQ